MMESRASPKVCAKCGYATWNGARCACAATAEEREGYWYKQAQKYSKQAISLHEQLCESNRKLKAIYDHFGPPQDDCECFMCAMQRTTVTVSADRNAPK